MQEVPQCQEHFHNEHHVEATMERLMGELGPLDAPTISLDFITMPVQEFLHWPG